MEKLVEKQAVEEVRSQSNHGRAGRKRKKRRARETSGTSPYAVDTDPIFIRLNQWLRSKGLQSSVSAKLRPAVFADTGRGLMATSSVRSGDTLVSIPRTALVTCSRVLENLELKASLEDSGLKFKAMEILSYFLLFQKYLGDKSSWQPYLDSLPSAYTVPAYCTDEEIYLFPDFLKTYAYTQRENVNECLVKLRTVVSTGNSDLRQMLSFLCYEDVRWAWFTVNTRTVYLKDENPSPLISDDDVCALAPYLDLLNHSTSAQVTTGINKVNGCYEIVTQVPYNQFSQVFISCGPHDNIKLCTEYGFILPDNPHNYVPVTLEELLSVVSSVDENAVRNATSVDGNAKRNTTSIDGNAKRNTTSIDRNSARITNSEWKIELICSHKADKNLSLSKDGPSWNLEVAMTVCLMTPSELLKDWNAIYSNPYSLGYRGQVIECLAQLTKLKVCQLRSCLEKLSDVKNCSEVCEVAKQLLEDYCEILENI